MKSRKYFVWRRNDGFVHASCGSKPSNWVAGGEATTFEHLAEFDNWVDARALIEKLRVIIAEDDTINH